MTRADAVNFLMKHPDLGKRMGDPETAWILPGAYQPVLPERKEKRPCVWIPVGLRGREG